MINYQEAYEEGYVRGLEAALDVVEGKKHELQETMVEYTHNKALRFAAKAIRKLIEEAKK